MGIFRNKPHSQEVTLYETNYLGFWIKVFSNRVEFKSGAGSESVPINQIASVHTGMIGMMKIILETTGGKRYSIPTFKKKEVQQAIYKAQSTHIDDDNGNPATTADEITRLFELKEKGILSCEEFEAKKKQLLKI